MQKSIEQMCQTPSQNLTKTCQNRQNFAKKRFKTRLGAKMGPKRHPRAPKIEKYPPRSAQERPRYARDTKNGPTGAVPIDLGGSRGPNLLDSSRRQQQK